MELKQEELILTTEQKDKKIKELELKQEELIQTTEQKDKKIKELELKLIKSYHFYIMHYSKEGTKNVFYYSLKYSVNGDEIKSKSTRCAPVGISDKNAIDITSQQSYQNRHTFHQTYSVLF